MLQIQKYDMPPNTTTATGTTATNSITPTLMPPALPTQPIALPTQPMSVSSPQPTSAPVAATAAAAAAPTPAQQIKHSQQPTIIRMASPAPTAGGALPTVPPGGMTLPAGVRMAGGNIVRVRAPAGVGQGIKVVGAGGQPQIIKTVQGTAGKKS